MHIISVKRMDHCRSPPAIGLHIIVQIHGQNISIDNNDTTSLNYTEGTLATYECKDSQPKTENDQQVWKCTQFKQSYNIHFNYSWAPIKKYAKDLDCGSNKGIFIRLSINLGNDAKLVRSK